MTCSDRPWRTGRVLDGVYAGWRVFIQRDDSGGHMNVCYESPTHDEGYDDWVEDDADLARYLAARPSASSPAPESPPAALCCASLGCEPLRVRPPGPLACPIAAS